MKSSKDTLTRMFIVMALFLALPTALAHPLPNDQGGHTHLNQLAPVNVVCGTYLRGAENGGQSINPATYAYIITGLTAQVTSNAIDNHWFHDTDGDFVVFDMGVPVSQVIFYPSIDHGPVPGEAFEGTIYGSNNLAAPENTWAVGDISLVYDPGWSGWIADDWVQVWDLPGAYRYIGVHRGGIKAMINDGDLEFDALCAPSQNDVPEIGLELPILLSMAAVPLLFLRKRRLVKIPV